MAGRLHRVVAADAECLPRLRRDVRGYLHAAGVVDDEFTWIVSLAVTEACGNVVRHAYPAGGGELELTAELDGGSMVVVVADTGVGMATRSQNPGLGLGTALMRATAADVHVDSDGQGTVVRMAFPLRGVGSAAAPAG